MKNISYLLIFFLFIQSCIDKDPQLDEADFKKEQQKYEALKTELDDNNEAFYLNNKEVIFNKIKLFKKLKDTTTAFNDVNNAKDFYLDSIKLKSINYFFNRNKDGVKAVFLNKGDRKTTRRDLIEPYNRLYYCNETNEEDNCNGISTKILQEFLDIKYVFIINGYRLIEPKIVGSKSFESGLYIGNILVYDIDQNKPLYSYTVSATNNEEISTYSVGRNNNFTIQTIVNDFEKNINKSIKEETLKHFGF